MQIVINKIFIVIIVDAEVEKIWKLRPGVAFIFRILLYCYPPRGWDGPSAPMKIPSLNYFKSKSGVPYTTNVEYFLAQFIKVREIENQVFIILIEKVDEYCLSIYMFFFQSERI